MSWTERALEEGRFVTGLGASMCLAQDDWGDLVVPSVRERIRRGEPWWVKPYSPRNPWHLILLVWSRVRGGFAYVEAQ